MKGNMLTNGGGKATRGICGYFSAYKQVLEDLPYAEIERVVGLLVRAREERRSVFLFGNGGSAALASHFACDLGKGTPREDPTRLFRVMSLCDNVAVMTAWANDKSYESVFSEQLQNLIVPGDIAFAISGSGNSPNVLQALDVARALGGLTVGLSGFTGGKLRERCDHCLIIPSQNMQIIEDFHLSVCHALFVGVCQAINRPSQLAAAVGYMAQNVNPH